MIPTPADFARRASRARDTLRRPLVPSEATAMHRHPPRSLLVLLSLSAPLVALPAAADELTTCRESVKSLEGAVSTCRGHLDACISDVAACEGAPVSARTGGVAQSSDGAAFVSIPPGALARDTPIRVVKVDLPKVDTKRVSAVYDFGPSTRFGVEAEICLSLTTPIGNDKACLGYLDESKSPPAWVCEDECLTNKDGQMCGKTTHFTNFAILLGGSNAGGKCDSDAAYFTGSFRKATKPSCDLAAERGLCLHEGARVLSTSTTLVSVVPLAVREGAEPSGETPAFVASLVDLAPGTPREVRLRAEGERVVRREPLSGRFSIVGSIAAPDATSRSWRLVLRTADGRTLSTPIDAPRRDRDPEEGLVTVVSRPADDGGEVHRLSGQTQVGRGWVRWNTVVHENDVVDR